MTLVQPKSRFRPAVPAIDRGDIKIAVILPCYNEAAAIGRTVDGFRAALPSAAIYVFDNNSTDGTAEVARQAGAMVLTERMQGKGNVVRRMFADVEADVYVMADGDATYDPDAAPAMIDLLWAESYDMVVGCRKDKEIDAYRRGHRIGNRLLTGCVATLFGRSFTDILSGYRVFSRRFVKSFPSLSSGFEIETDITIHALGCRLPVGEIETDYFARPDGSVSKLSTWRDGLRILWMIGNLFRQEKPFAFYGLIALCLVLSSIGLAVPLAITYAETGLVPRFPTAILCSSLMLLAALCFVSGLILDTVTRGRREIKRLVYLGLSSVGATQSYGMSC